MSNVQVSGTLRAGPTSSASGTFPTMVATASLSLKTASKGFAAATGILTRNIAFVNFTDLGEPGNAVAKANLLYLKSQTPLELRLTQDDGQGGDVVSVLHVDGLYIQEFTDANFLKKLEVKGTGIIEYFLSGPS